MFKKILLLLILSSAFYATGITDPKNFPTQQCKFIENKGQFLDENGKPVPFVLFRSSAPGIDYYITNTGITYVFSMLSDDENKERQEGEDQGSESGKVRPLLAKVKTEKIELLLQNANIQLANIIKEGASSYHYNYFYSHCPDGIYDVREYEKIAIKDVYPGIDWVLYGGSSKGVKYDFVIHPGADASLIKLLYRSANPARLGTEGQIILKTSLGQLTESPPLSYIENNKQKINSAFQLISKTHLSKYYETVFQFEGEFENNKDQVIIIDPQLVWATFYGGNLLDGPMAMETDAAGNVFTCGYTYSTNYPVNNTGAFFQSTNANIANFITKFTNTGALSWSTYYASNNPEREPKGLAIDKFGNIYVAGETFSTSFPLQNNGGYFQTTTSAPISGEIFILKFTNSGIRLWATLFGGNDEDSANFIDTDSLGNLYLGGRTFSNNFPLMNGGGYYQSSYFATNAGIGILAKFDANCNLLWSTHFGNYYSNVNAVNCDKFNNLYITGMCSGVGVPTVNPGGGAYFQAAASPTNGNFTCFVSKFSPQTNLIWSTQYGGSSYQYGYSIITDTTGNVFVAGRSSSSNFPVQFSSSTYSQSNSGATANAFILKFNGAGVRQWGTFCGGNVAALFDTFDNLAVDPCNQDVYLTFSTATNSLLSQAACGGGYLQSVLTSSTWLAYSTDVAILKFSNGGALLWSTYLAGKRDDFRSAVACDHNSNLYMTGEWTSTVTNTYPLVNPGNGAFFNSTHNGGQDDGYLVKFTMTSQTSTATISYPMPICNTTGSIVPNLSPGASGNFSASPGLSIHPLTGVINVGASALGSYTVSFTPNSCGCTASPTQTCLVTLSGGPLVSISASATSICSGNTINLQASSPAANLTYTWLPGASNNQSIAAGPTISTVYTLQALDVISDCSVSNTILITVDPNPTVNISGASSLCNTNSAILSSTGNGSFSWSTGQTGNSITVSPSLTTVYSLTCSDANGCTAQASHTIFVLPSPTLSIVGPTSVCKGAVISLTAAGAANYLWSNSSIANIYSTVLNQSETVSVTGTGANDCQSTQTISLLVLNCTGLSEIKNTSPFVQIYPNPSSGEISVKSDFPVELMLEDERGRLIQKILIEEQGQIITIKLNEGIYFLRGDIHGKKLVEKIVITH